MTEQWIVIPGWEAFQHYKKRRPAWIKLYTDLLHKDEYLDLTAHQRAVLHGLWITYAEKNAQVRLNTTSLSSRLNLRVMMRDLEALNHAGFIEFSASRPLAHCYARDRDRDIKNLEIDENQKVKNLSEARSLARRLKESA